MTAAPFVVGGWALTALSVGTYAALLARRERRARRLLDLDLGARDTGAGDARARDIRAR